MWLDIHRKRSKCGRKQWYRRLSHSGLAVIAALAMVSVNPRHRMNGKNIFKMNIKKN